MSKDKNGIRDIVKNLIKDFTMDELLESLEIIRRENRDKIIDYVREMIKPEIKTLQELIDDFNKENPEIFEDVDLSKIYTEIIGSDEHRDFINKIISSDNLDISEYLVENKYFMEDTYAHFREKCGFCKYDKKMGVDNPDYSPIYRMINDIIELRCFFEMGKKDVDVVMEYGK